MPQNSIKNILKTFQKLNFSLKKQLARFKSCLIILALGRKDKSPVDNYLSMQAAENWDFFLWHFLETMRTMLEGRKGGGGGSDGCGVHNFS